MLAEIPRGKLKIGKRTAYFFYLLIRKNHKIMKYSKYKIEKKLKYVTNSQVQLHTNIFLNQNLKIK